MPNDFLTGSIVGVKEDESKSITTNLSESESMTGQVSSGLELTGSIQTDSDYEETDLIGSVSVDITEENSLTGEIDDPSGLNGDVSPSEMELFGDVMKPGVTNDYNDLVNLPSIEGVPVKGELTSDDLGLQRLMSEISTTEIIQMWNKIMNE